MDTFDHNHIWHPYASIPNKIKTHKVLSADGVYLNLENNTKVIDGMSSWWSTIHGYNHPLLNQALQKQTEQMAHVMFGGLTHQSAIDLAKLLIQITPKRLDRIFFADSGSVSVEVALKMTLQYWQNNGQSKKTRFITPLGGYHGDTFGAMSVCDPENGMHYLFADLLPKHFFVMRPTMDNLEEAIKDLRNNLARNHQQIASMIIEPMVQGAGGMNIYPAEYLKQARMLCDEFDVLLIFDEIATGFGRTGTLFALEHANTTPDILCLGKALTGGYMTLAATLTSQKVAKGVETLMHGPTFMANPLACAVAKSSVELLLSSNWKKQVHRIEKHLKQSLLPLKQHEKILDARVIGAIGVLEFNNEIDVEKVQNHLIEQGVWLRPFGRLLYTMPAFIISDEELSNLTQAIETVVDL